MEMEFDVKVTAGVMYDYLLYHTYTSFSGMIGTLVGVILIMTFLSTNNLFYSHCRCCADCVPSGGRCFWERWGRCRIRPHSKSRCTTKWQRKASVYHREKTRKTRAGTVVWRQYRRGEASFSTHQGQPHPFSEKRSGDKKEALIQMISTHMPPKKVKIRF